MKKSTVAMMAMVALAMVPSASWALPEVQLSPSCSYLVSIDTWANAAMSGLGLGSYATVDFDVDGVPDKFQFGLLAAALCAGDAGLIAQWNLNNTAVGTYLATFNAFVAQEPAVAVALRAVKAPLQLFYNTYGPPPGANTIPAPALPAFVLLLVGNVSPPLPNIGAIADALDDGQEIVMALPAFVPWINAQMGISTESADALQDIWTEFFGLFPLYGGVLIGYEAPALAGVAAVVGNPAYPTPPGATMTNAQLVAALTGAGGARPGALALGAILAGLSATLPPIDIYGTAKTALEPFSGEGDYNDNGDTNKEVYDASGGDRTNFVKYASGFDPFYTGNPDLPVAGILGLALLAGACVLGGAASIRRK